MAVYKTKQRDIINKTIRKMNKPFTIKGLKEYFDKKKLGVGLTTIYREVDELVRDGILIPIVSDNNSLSYQYTPECDSPDHLYLKCEECGKMIHVDCNEVSKLSNHIAKDHKFHLNNHKTILSGVCEDCEK